MLGRAKHCTFATVLQGYSRLRSQQRRSGLSVGNGISEKPHFVTIQREVAGIYRC